MYSSFLFYWDKVFLRTLFRFSLVGIAATVVYFVSANILIYFDVLPATRASIIAYMLGMSVSFLGQSRFTFVVTTWRFQHFIRFCIMSLAGLFISWFSVYLATVKFGISPSWGTLLTSISIPLLSYAVMKHWVFQPKKDIPINSELTVSKTRGWLTELFPFLETSSPRFGNVFTIVLSMLTIIWLIFTVFMLFVGFTGDEVFYFQAVRQMGNFFSGQTTLRDMIGVLVGNGWFMPGIPLLLIPTLALPGDLSFEIVRIYISTANFVLWLWTIRETGNRVGPAYGLSTLIFPAVCITYIMFKSTIWGDLPAGLLLVVAAARVYSIALATVRRQLVKSREYVLLAIIVSGAIYLRGSLFLFGFAAVIFLAAVSLIFLHRALFVHQIARITTILGLILLFISPWSLMASSVLKSFVFTTSTIDLSLGITFGSNQKLCFGPCPKGNIWINAARFSRERATESGRSELVIQKEMAESALADLTLDSYTHRVRKNFESFLFMPYEFNTRFIGSNAVLSEVAKVKLQFVAKWINNVPYFLFLLFAALANLDVSRRGVSSQLLSLILKMSFACLLVQPFFHPSHARYWVTFAPLMALSGAYVCARFSVLESATEFSLESAEPSSMVLTGLQATYASLFAAIMLAVIFVF